MALVRWDYFDVGVRGCSGGAVQLWVPKERIRHQFELIRIKQFKNLNCERIARIPCICDGILQARDAAPAIRIDELIRAD